MRGLSNLLGLRDPSGREPVLCRKALPSEIDSALRLLLVSPAGLATDAHVADFTQMTQDRGIDLSQLWIAHRNGMILWTLLPVVSPGKTMLLFTPGRLPRGSSPDAVKQLVNSLLEHHRNQGVQLAQFLLEPSDRSIVRLYEGCGFTVLAELLYLQRAVRNPVRRPSIPMGLTLETYSPENHAAFAQAVQQSYRDSLDCPALNGKRDIEDVLTGHRTTGEFDPRLWFMLKEDDQPLGVLLLTRAIHGAAIELVYLGLSPEARGRSLGDWFMMLALAITHETGSDNLSLAVDSQNRPAMKLYFRHGMSRMGSRIAMLREMRSS